MWDWSGFGGTFGCLWAFVKGMLLVYAILAVAVGEATAHEWGILISVTIFILAGILSRWTTKKDYNRKDSYWSKKEEDSEEK